MSYSNISASLSEAQVAQIDTQIQAILASLDFLINLSPDERHTLRKMGDKLTSYVEDALEVAKANRGYLPSNVDLAEFEKDLSLAKNLDKILIRLRPLVESIQDTATAAGNEAIKVADLSYGYLKQAARSDAGLDDTIKVLGARFKSSRTAEKEPLPIMPVVTQ
jgi:hypothetical protein